MRGDICLNCLQLKEQIERDKRREEEMLAVPWAERVENKSRRARDAAYRRAYGISLADYERLYQNQRGRCAICGKRHPQLLVDHDHARGYVRGLLCHSCNWGLGHFFDLPKLLEKAIRYLKEHP